MEPVSTERERERTEWRKKNDDKGVEGRVQGGSYFLEDGKGVIPGAERRAGDGREGGGDASRSESKKRRREEAVADHRND